jgi:hypothetical protein
MLKGVVYGANHCAGHLGEAGPLRPCDNVEKETLKGGLRRWAVGRNLCPPRPLEGVQNKIK